MDIDYYSFPLDDTIGYMRWHLEALKRQGVKLKTLLDIGAAHGHFSRLFTEYWDVGVTAIECNRLDQHYLDEMPWTVHYACLGKEECEKTFYLDRNDPIGGGSSFYKENTKFFKDAVKQNKKIVTLDSLGLPQQDFVKIDTQGSEVDVIAGGQKTLSAARYLLIECSFVEYNKGGCLIDDVVSAVRPLGFQMIDTFGPAHGGHVWDDRKIQADVLFAKESENVFAFSSML